MSKINFKMSTLYRMLQVCTCDKKQPGVARFEIYNKKMFGIATNGTIGIVEYLGETDQENDFFHIKFLKNFVESVKNMRFVTDDAVIDTIPEIASGTITCQSLINTDCVIFPETSVADDWKTWFVEEPSESLGCMYWKLFHVQMLFECSPSGELVFPAKIDAKKPLMLRDANDSHWVGFFVPSAKDVVLPETKMPEWWTK